MRKTRNNKKWYKQYFEGKNGQCSQLVCQGKAGSQYLRRPWRDHGAGFKNPGVGWQYFREPRRWFRISRVAAASVGKSGGALEYENKGAWYLTKIKGYLTYVADIWLWIKSVGIDFQLWSKELRRQEEIIGLVPMYVGDIWLGSMSVWDTWVGIDVIWGCRYR